MTEFLKYGILEPLGMALDSLEAVLLGGLSTPHLEERFSAIPMHYLRLHDFRSLETCARGRSSEEYKVQGVTAAVASQRVAGYTSYKSAINKLLRGSNTALSPNILKLPQVRMLIIPTLLINSPYRINKTDLASSPLLIAGLPLLHTIKRTAGYNRNPRHARTRRQHGTPAIATEATVDYFAGLCIAVIVLL